MQGPWQSGGWDSSVCDFSFSRLRVETQSLIRELGTNMPCGMAKKKKKKKHTCKCHLNVNNRLPYTHDKKLSSLSGLRDIVGP